MREPLSSLIRDISERKKISLCIVEMGGEILRKTPYHPVMS